MWKQWELSLDPTYLHGSFNGHGSFYIHLALAPLRRSGSRFIERGSCLIALGAGGRHLFNSEEIFCALRICLIEVIV